MRHRERVRKALQEAQPARPLHRSRISTDSYQPSSIAYGSARKAKVPKVARVKCAAHTFHGPLGGPFQALVRSLAAMSDRIRVRTAPEKVHNGSVAYRVVKLEKSNSALWTCRQAGLVPESKGCFF